MPMPVVRSPAQVPAKAAPLALAVGVFDGVHLGHQAVLAEARARAAAAGGRAWALTFDPHPRQVLHPDRAPDRLTPETMKDEALAAAGMDGALVLAFTPELAGLEAEAFLEGLAARLPPLCAVVTGANWRFGHRARGTPALLRACAARLGFEAVAVPPVAFDGAPVSSTRIRAAVRAGRMEEAAAMLGRPFALRGPVEHGRAIGRTLGFPTANIDALRGFHPPHGVYAARVELDGAHHPAGVYIGRRPTYGAEGHPALEAYVMDFDGDLYGRTLTVELLRRLRGDRAFPSPEALRDQIALDLDGVRSAAAMPLITGAGN
jgi:riboflavin kinase / FMN adenylyltransferase